MLIYVSVLRPGEPGFESIAQSVPALPAINDSYIFEDLSWRVVKVAHMHGRIPLVYLGEARSLTSTEKDYFS